MMVFDIFGVIEDYVVGMVGKYGYIGLCNICFIVYKIFCDFVFIKCCLNLFEIFCNKGCGDELI